MKKNIYLDYAAATPLDKKVLRAMAPFFSKQFANPSALYGPAVAARTAVESARQQVGAVLGAPLRSVIFTSGGTEGNNLAIQGVARASTKPGHIVALAIEHETVLKPLSALKALGWEVTLLPMPKEGVIAPQQVIQAIKPNTVLVSIMYANNEVGAIQPIADIGRAILHYRKLHASTFPYFHTDACQAPAFLDLHVEKLHVDLLTLNGGKMYGPKGSGCLYVRPGVVLTPLMYGGTHEGGFRAGTENVPAIVGFSVALKMAHQQVSATSKKISSIATLFAKELARAAPTAELNGPAIGEHRLPNNLNFYFPGIDGETLVLYLSEQGVMCATGSACTTATGEPSHVLVALGYSLERSKSSVRFTFGAATTRSNVLVAIAKIKRVLQLLAGKR